MKILIVEDEDICLRYLKMLVSKYGKCDVSVDGEDALYKWKEAHRKREPYDLIFMDIMMPNMDGQLALKMIRDAEVDEGIAENERCKIIMTTALYDSKNITESFRRDADGYIVKPIRREKVLDEMRKLNLLTS